MVCIHIYVLDRDNSPEALQLECLTRGGTPDSGVPRGNVLSLSSCSTSCPMALDLLPPVTWPCVAAAPLAYDTASCTRLESLTTHLVHFSLGIWSTHSWGRGTKPQSERNSAMLDSLPSCQTTALAVVDIGSGPYVSACQRLVNACHRMRMPLKISRFTIWEVKSGKTCAFLCHSCIASFTSQQVCNPIQNTVSSFFLLSFGRHFHVVLPRGAVSVEQHFS